MSMPGAFNAGNPSTPPFCRRRRRRSSSDSPEGGALVHYTAPRVTAPRTEEQEEIGRLSSAVHAMATQLTEAFAEMKDLRQSKEQCEAKIVDLEKEKAALEKEIQDLFRHLALSQSTPGFPYGIGGQGYGVGGLPGFGGMQNMSGGVLGMGPFGMPMPMMMGGMMPNMSTGHHRHHIPPPLYQPNVINSSQPTPQMPARPPIVEASAPSRPPPGRQPLSILRKSPQEQIAHFHEGYQRGIEKALKGKGKEKEPVDSSTWSGGGKNDKFPPFNQKTADEVAALAAMEESAMRQAMQQSRISAMRNVAGPSNAVVDQKARNYKMPVVLAHSEYSLKAFQSQQKTLKKEAQYKESGQQVSFGVATVDLEARELFMNQFTAVYRLISNWVDTYANECLPTDKELAPTSTQPGNTHLWHHLMACVHKRPSDAFAHLVLLLKEVETRSALIMRMVVQFLFDFVWVEEMFLGFEDGMDKIFHQVNGVLNSRAILEPKERRSLIEHKCRVIETIIAHPSYREWRESKAATLSKQLRAYLLPFLKPNVVKSEAGTDISVFVNTAISISQAMFTSRKTFIPIFPECGQKFSMQSMLCRTSSESGHQLQIRQVRVKLVITPMITMREETEQGPTATLIHISNVMIMN